MLFTVAEILVAFCSRTYRGVKNFTVFVLVAFSTFSIFPNIFKIKKRSYWYRKIPTLVADVVWPILVENVYVETRFDIGAISKPMFVTLG